MAQRNFYYVKECAALLGVTTQAVTKLIHREDLAAGRLGSGRWRVEVRTLRAYADKHRITLNYEALRSPEGKINAPAFPSPGPYIPAIEGQVAAR